MPICPKCGLMDCGAGYLGDAKGRELLGILALLEDAKETGKGNAGTRGNGPSGKAMIHIPHYGSQKDAKDAARQGGDRAPEHHTAHAPDQWDHYHSVDRAGNIIKDRVHYTYGPKKG